MDFSLKSGIFSNFKTKNQKYVIIMFMGDYSGYRSSKTQMVISYIETIDFSQKKKQKSLLDLNWFVIYESKDF